MLKKEKNNNKKGKKSQLFVLNPKNWTFFD